MSTEHGVMEGSGVRIIGDDVEEAKLSSPFVAKLYNNGVLELNENFGVEFAERLGKKWEGKVDELKKNPQLKELFADDMANHQLFLTYAGLFDRKVPASWRDPDAIVDSYRNAKAADIQLPLTLKLYGLIHPSEEVRTTLYETQELTSRQQAVLGFAGISRAHPDHLRLQSLAYLSMPYMEIALNSEFGTAKNDEELSEENSTQIAPPKINGRTILYGASLGLSIASLGVAAVGVVRRSPELLAASAVGSLAAFVGVKMSSPKG